MSLYKHFQTLHTLGIQTDARHLLMTPSVLPHTFLLPLSAVGALGPGLGQTMPHDMWQMQHV